MLWTVLQLVILVTHSHAARNHDESRVTVSCPEYQMGFGGSCYQLVAQRQSSFSAEAWCEEHGGHLAFIPNKDTQQFLQKYLDPEEDMWLGVAPPISPNSESAPGEGALSWLDGSPITYSNWGSNPQPGAACGYILKNSGFRWEATTQCNKKLHFICQFESGRFIVCRSSQTTLQCGSGQVLIIDSGFYGRKNVHYCRAAFSPPTTATQCGWVDVGTSVAAHCHGSQSCQLADIVKSFDEPCPELGSYLSLDYHCKNGLKLTVSTVAAVFDNITIKWLLTLSSGNISCRLRTGDGRVTYLDNYTPSFVEHKISFVVAVECRSNDTHITAQRTITILEPVTGLSVTGCYSGKLSFNASYCRALNGDVFKIQTEVKAGSNVTYRIQNDEVVLSGLSVVRGNVPHNITVTPDVVRQLGPGCHQLIINASNNVTFPDVSTDLQVNRVNVYKNFVSCQYSGNQTFYSKYTIKTSSSTGKPSPKPGEHSEEDATITSGSGAKGPNTFTSKPVIKTIATSKRATSPLTTKSPGSFSCSISPSNGTIFTAFSITCKTVDPCPHCRYCFKTGGKHLRCSKKNEVKSVFLPLGKNHSNHKLMITATAKHKSFVCCASMTQLVGQIVNTVSKKVNDQYNKTEKVYRQKVLSAIGIEPFLSVFVTLFSIINYYTTIKKSSYSVPTTKLCDIDLQEDASLLFANLSASLLDLDLDNSEENIKEIYTAASNIVEGISTILSYSSSVSHLTLWPLLLPLRCVICVISKYNVNGIYVLGVFVARNASLSVCEGRLQKDVNIPNSSSSTFSLPDLPSNIFPSEEPVDIRMLSLNNNPFSWNERANISGQIAALSFTKTDGSSISVENLSKEIEILLPRPIGEQVETSVFDLGNFSTTVIDIHSTDSTLVLKDPLPFKLFLGYLSYPTTTKYVAMTEMPHQGNTEEERYTWLLDPKSLKGNTGVHYLVVRPIVGPGIKSINASLSITSFTAACKFWNESTLDWSDTGCRVGPQTTQFFTQCLCNHLTFFGSSFFVTPNLIDPSRSAELFGTFAENPVVVCFVGSLFAAYLLVLVWARRKDIQDTAKVNVTVLVDNDPMDKYCYLISVSTGHRRGASTSSQVTVTLLGADGNSEPHHLTDQKKSVFERAINTVFVNIVNVTVQDLQTNQKWHFLCNSWLSIDIDDCCLDKVFPVSTEMDLKKFRNVFFMKTTKDFSDGHLWYSVISRPPNSTFTCVQRVSCCFSLLLCTMLTSIMFYGIPADPSEQNMDFGHFEFTLQQFMIGVQSSLIMFPVNILIVSIFRNTHPWDMSCCKNKTKKPDALEQEKNLRTPSPQIATANINVTLDTIIKDITRIAHSLSTTMKSNIPCTMSEFGPGQQIDINAILSVVEDFIKQNNKTSESTQSETQLPEDSLRVQPGTEMEGNQKKSNKAQYLYLLLCHIDKELSLLGSSGFPSPHSYSQALQQVQGMKSLSVVAFNRMHSPSPLQKKKGYCHEGLPWWFIFIGWLLVIATSVVSGFFTMLYGLKFGKERSISWLVSMIVSFFQSILVIQPLKVLSLALFFALVIKKVDEEECKNVPFLRNNSNLGDCTGQQIFRRDKNLYEPPPPADIEKIKRNKMMEQKAFALLREILTYSCFIWMLLLVAYSQRDPNAFFLNQHIRDSFSEGISDSMSLDDVFKWLNTSLLGNLFGVYPGFITDGNSKLVGFARLRQLRVQKNSCEFADSVLQFVPDCHALYSREAEDTGSYGNAWNLSVMGNISTGTSSPWRYQTQAQLRAPPVWGKIMLYRGGGFVTELGPDMQNASSTLGYLYRSKWLDVYTQAFFVEFTVYNANVNLFCIVTLMFETSAVGAFQFRSELQSIRLYQSTGGFHIFVMAAEIIYMLFILYYMFLQGKLLKQQRWAYFRNKWNLLELAIILLSWSAMAIFIRRTLLGDRDMAYYQNHKDQFASFYESAMADLILQRLIAFLTLLATVKLWRLLRLNPNMNMITATLQRAWGDISGFLVIIVIAFLAYSIVCNMIYGWRISSYHTLADALLTIICLQIGIFNYDEVLDHNLLLGGLLFGSCIIMVTFVLLNILISVILGAFKQEQIHHKVKPVTKPLKPVMRLSESQNKFKCLICTVMTDTVQVKADT
uniref:Polycystic kidney disease 1 like 2a n=1 Tax=Echeneis naucrates TaxID=173247 RepID=A0A665VH41_ECHNA